MSVFYGFFIGFILAAPLSLVVFSLSEIKSFAARGASADIRGS